MNKNIARLTTTVAGLLLAGLVTASAANAATTGAPPMLDQSAMKQASSEPTTLRQAVLAVEKAAKGAVFDSAVILKNGALVYEVKVSAAGKYMLYDVNPKTGNVTSSSELKDPDLNTLKSLADAKIKIEAAIATAEKSGKGRAIQAAFTTQDKSRTFVIEILEKNDALKTFTIDAATGNVLKTS